MRRVLALAGGGFKGAFQAGALRELEAYGYNDFYAVYGVSVGSLNAAGYVRGGCDLLDRLWASITEKDAFKRYSWPKVAWRFLTGKLGAYDLSPLSDYIKKNLGTGVLPAKVGYVRLDTGEYVSAWAAPKSILASCSIPVIWEPVDGYMVDGGVRNVTPLAEALATDPDEVVVILCNRLAPEPADRPKNVLDVATRAMDLAMNEISREDIQQFIRINDLVQQAGRHNVSLVKPDGGLYRYAKLTVIEPPESLGSTLDSSQVTLKRRYELGRRAVRELFDERRAA